MEFPFGHHHHQHHRNDDDGEERDHLPPHLPPAGESFFPHQHPSEYAPPPPFFEPPPPPFFESHPHNSSPYGAPHEREEGHRRRPAYSDDASFDGDGGSVNKQQTVRVFTKAEESYSLSIRDGKVVLAREDPRDQSQHWIKDMRYSTNVKDEESFPAFALVNKATGEAIKHSIGATHPVQLVPYNPNFLDESVLWTESRDLGDGFRCIRMVNNILLNFDAFNGDEDHGGVHEGTVIVLWEWLEGKNQRWKIVPY